MIAITVPPGSDILVSDPTMVTDGEVAESAVLEGLAVWIEVIIVVGDGVAAAAFCAVHKFLTPSPLAK
jgi:hypothetical protein